MANFDNINSVSPDANETITYIKDLSKIKIIIHENILFIIFKKWYNDLKGLSDLNINDYPEILNYEFQLNINYMENGENKTIDLSNQFKNITQNYFRIEFESKIDLESKININYKSKLINSDESILTYEFKTDDIKDKYLNTYNLNNDLITSKMDINNLKILFLNVDSLQKQLNIFDNFLKITNAPILINISNHELNILKNIFKKNLLYNPYFNQIDIESEFKNFICIFKIYEALDYQFYDFVKFKNDLFIDENFLSLKTIIYDYDINKDTYINKKINIVSDFTKYLNYLFGLFKEKNIEDYVIAIYFTFFSDNQNDYFNTIIQTEYTII